MKRLRDPKRKPTHPGELLREEVLPALKMTQTEFARRLGVSRLSVSELLLEKRALLPDMAIRVGRLTNTTPESWLRMQEALDLWELERQPKRYEDIEPLQVAAWGSASFAALTNARALAHMFKLVDPDANPTPSFSPVAA